jgi:flagellar hook-length control protein FliK
VLRFRLNPETLGTLNVELSQGAQGASVRLTAETEAARAIIAEAQPRLIAEARAQGVRIAEAHVDLGGGGGASGQSRRHGEETPTFVRTHRQEPGDPAADLPRRAASDRYA